MKREPGARRAAAILGVILIGTSLAVFAMDAEISAATTASAAESSSATAATKTSGTNSSAASASTTTSAVNSSITSSTSTSTQPPVPLITFSSPVPNSTFAPGQEITIVGTISPAPTSGDRVIIEANQLNRMPVIKGAIVNVGSNGGFSFAVDVGSNWDAGVYTVSVTDLSGLTGYCTFAVQNATS